MQADLKAFVDKYFEDHLKYLHEGDEDYVAPDPAHRVYAERVLEATLYKINYFSTAFLDDEHRIIWVTWASYMHKVTVPYCSINMCSCSISQMCARFVYYIFVGSGEESGKRLEGDEEGREVRLHAVSFVCICRQLI